MKRLVVLVGLMAGMSAVCAAAESADESQEKAIKMREPLTIIRKDVTQEETQFCRQLLDRYVQAWISGDAKAMQECFTPHFVPVDWFRRKIKRETEEKKRPEKFAEFIGMSVTKHGTVDMYFTLDTQAGTQRYTAIFACFDSGVWRISSVEHQVPQEIADALRKRVREYVAAWVEGSAPKMFACMDGINMTEAEFVNAVQGKLADGVKPTRLEHTEIPRFGNSGEIRVSYVVSVQDKKEGYTAIFTFDKEQKKWKFVGNGNTPTAKK